MYITSSYNTLIFLWAQTTCIRTMAKAWSASLCSTPVVRHLLRYSFFKRCASSQIVWCETCFKVTCWACMLLNAHVWLLTCVHFSCLVFMHSNQHALLCSPPKVRHHLRSHLCTRRASLQITCFLGRSILNTALSTFFVSSLCKHCASPQVVWCETCCSLLGQHACCSMRTYGF